MRHPKEGQLRAFYDGALNPSQEERVQAHLAACTQCAQKAEKVRARGTHVHTQLDGMDAQPAHAPVASQVARHRLNDYLVQKETAMRQNMFSRRYRPVWAATALIVVFGLLFAFAPVRTLAGNLLALFRVQQITFVEVNPANLSDPDALEETMRKFASVMEDQVAIEIDGESTEMDAATAREQAGFAVRFPAALNGEPLVTLEPAVHAAMQVDLPSARALLTELGYDVELPDSLDGAQVSIDFEGMVSATYGTCKTSTSGESGKTGTKKACTEYVQMPAPQVSAPPELDLDQLGRAYLQLLGMSAQEAEAFSQRVNWATTLVVPLPTSANRCSCHSIIAATCRENGRRGYPVDPS